jgi:hypothetical protein
VDFHAAKLADFGNGDESVLLSRCNTCICPIFVFVTYTYERHSPQLDDGRNFSDLPETLIGVGL